MIKSIFITAVAAGSLFAAAAFAAPEVGQPAPDFSATDAHGKTVNLADFKGKNVVLEWHNAECPFVRKHYMSGNMQKLQAYAKEKEVVWLTINSSAPDKQGHMDQAKAKDFVDSNNHASTHYLVDPQGNLGRLYEAKTTPHMFVIDAEGNVAYMGAIDDKPTAEIKDIDGAKNYVRTAIDSILESKPVMMASSQPYGCSVKYAN